MNWTQVEDAVFDFVVATSGLTTDKVVWATQNAKRPAAPFIAMRFMRVESVGQDWDAPQDNPLVLADDVVESINATTDELTLTAHAYLTGDGPLRFTTTGVLPAPLTLTTDLWAIKVSANVIKLATSLANANAGTALNLTDVGSGVHTIIDQPTTLRVGQELTFKRRGIRYVTLSMQAFTVDATGASAAAQLLERVRASSTLPARHSALKDAEVSILSWTPILALDGVINSTTFEPRASVEARLLLHSEVSDFSTFIDTVGMVDQIPDPDSTFTVE